MTQDKFTLTVENLTYRAKSHTILEELNAAATAKQGMIVKGESGRGKTSLIKLLAGLDVPTSGRIKYNEIELNTLTLAERAHFRRRYMGIAFQNTHIVPSLTVRQNLALALQIHDPDKFFRSERIDQMLEYFEISHRAGAYIETLSGGEARRVALARAFVSDPKIVLLDEPLTGLDSELAERIAQKIQTLKDETGALIIISTHNMKISKVGRVKLDLDNLPEKAEEQIQDQTVAEVEHLKAVVREKTQIPRALQSIEAEPSVRPPRPEEIPTSLEQEVSESLQQQQVIPEGRNKRPRRSFFRKLRAKETIVVEESWEQETSSLENFEEPRPDAPQALTGIELAEMPREEVPLEQEKRDPALVKTARQASSNSKKPKSSNAAARSSSSKSTARKASTKSAAKASAKSTTSSGTKAARKTSTTSKPKSATSRPKAQASTEDAANKTSSSKASKSTKTTRSKTAPKVNGKTPAKSSTNKKPSSKSSASTSSSKTSKPKTSSTKKTTATGKGNGSSRGKSAKSNSAAQVSASSSKARKADQQNVSGE